MFLKILCTFVLSNTLLYKNLTSMIEPPVFIRGPFYGVFRSSSLNSRETVSLQNVIEHYFFYNLRPIHFNQKDDVPLRFNLVTAKNSRIQVIYSAFCNVYGWQYVWLGWISVRCTVQTSFLKFVCKPHCLPAI